MSLHPYPYLSLVFTPIVLCDSVIIYFVLDCLDTCLLSYVSWLEILMEIANEDRILKIQRTCK